MGLYTICTPMTSCSLSLFFNSHTKTLFSLTMDYSILAVFISFSTILIKPSQSLQPFVASSMLENVRLDDKSIMWKREIHQCLLFAEDGSWSLGALSQRMDAAEVRPRAILNFVEEVNQKSVSKVLGLEGGVPELPFLVYIVVNNE